MQTTRAYNKKHKTRTVRRNLLFLPSAHISFLSLRLPFRAVQVINERDVEGLGHHAINDKKLYSMPDASS